MAKPLCRLYLITPPTLEDLAAYGRELAHALDAGDVAALQIRLKGAPDDLITAAVDALAPIAASRDVAVILNDRPDLAAKLGCDGVHVGQDDATLAEARALLGRDRMVGVTCHASLHLAMEAAEGGADYVAFGAFFATTTKNAPIRAELDLLSGWQKDMVTPCVAIGGITVATARTIAAAGADFVAISAGVWAYSEGPAAAVKALNIELAQGVAERT